MRDNKNVWRACAVVAGLGAVACGPQNVLKPAKTANEVAGIDNAIRAQQSGVTLVAIADAWEEVGLRNVLNEVTPLRLIIENNSSQPVQIKYSNFVLSAEDGPRRYAALPPLQIEGEITERAGAINPGWTATGYQVAPYYGTTYGNYTSVWGGPFAYDYGYYDTYYPIWAELELPTEEMLQHALPEGTLQPGGRIDGFVYFERVGDDEDGVVLQAQMVSPEGNQPVATLTLPFDVEN